MTMLADFQRLMQPEVEAAPDTLEERIAADGAGGQPAITSAFQRANTALINELIARIHAQQPEFFEYLVIDMLLPWATAGGGATWRSA